MLIRCPECHFERDIDSDAIPANATVAACPRCGTRFRFRDPHNAQAGATPPPAGQTESSGDGDSRTDASQPAAGSPPAAPVPHLPTEQEGDDPLPPGAIIPRMDDAADGPSGADPAHNTPENTAGQNEAAEPQKVRRSWFGLRRYAEQDADADDRNPSWPPADELHGQDGEERRYADAGAWNDVPWENPERYGFLSSFVQTVLRAMFHAPDFFRQMGGNAPLTRPVFFYVLLSFFQTIMTRVWSMNSLQELSQNVTDPQALARIDLLMQGLNTPLMLVMTPFIMIAQLFVFAAFYHLMIRLAQPDRASFNTVVRVIAYSASPLVLCVVPFWGATIGSVWFLTSTFVGCKYALNLSWSRTALALLPLFLLALAVMLAMLQASLMLAPAAS